MKNNGIIQWEMAQVRKPAELKVALQAYLT
jgi:hypothetical protein